MDCKATLELLIDGNYEELKNFERCFEYNQLSSISYFCPLLESSKPTRRPQQKGEKEAYFAKLKQICGMAGNLSKLFEKELFHSNIQTPSSGCSTMTEEEVANIEIPLSDKNDWGKPCKFPFKYKGKEFVSCTGTKRTDDNGEVIDKDKFWCATEVNENDQMVKSGVCKEMCSNGMAKAIIYVHTVTIYTNWKPFADPNYYDYDLGTNIIGGLTAEDHQFPFMAG